MTTTLRERRTPERVEWQTLGVMVAFVVAMAATMAIHDRVPATLTVLVLAVLGGWWMSLQHEAVHGHPTPWVRVNTALFGTPLSLWCPYPEYRRSHLRHHDSDLTTPGLDPESFHVDAAAWSDAGALWRALLWCHRPLLGRLLIGPAITLARLPAAVLAERADRRTLRVWGTHVLAVAATCWVLFDVVGLVWWQYVLGFVYGGLSITYLRSFAEHQWEDGDGGRTAVIRSNAAFGLLFLNNNLHLTHHAHPHVAWYRLPGLHEEIDADRRAAAGAGWYRGYGELVRRYGLRPFGEPLHPSVELRGAEPLRLAPAVDGTSQG